MNGEIFLNSALAIVIFMCVMFILAQLKKDNSIVDIGWGIGFIIVAWTCWFTVEDHNLRLALINAAVTIWGIRLAGYLAYRNLGKPEDYRYVEMRKKWGKWQIPMAFLQVFMLQGVIMYIVSLVIMTPYSLGTTDPDLWLYLGVFVFVIGFLIESIADYQKDRFKKKPGNVKKPCDVGIWRYSRHANYFGEMVLWFGILGIAAGTGKVWLSAIGPVVITFFLIKVSGVAMLERKYENDPAYKEYIEKTSAFVPMPPR